MSKCLPNTHLCAHQGKRFAQGGAIWSQISHRDIDRYFCALRFSQHYVRRSEALSSKRDVTVCVMRTMRSSSPYTSGDSGIMMSLYSDVFLQKRGENRAFLPCVRREGRRPESCRFFPDPRAIELQSGRPWTPPCPSFGGDQLLS